MSQFNILCDVDQFFGIEIEEFPAQIAQTALWLMDHQMNMRVSEEFGKYFARLPLQKSATIIHGNALQHDWREIEPDQSRRSWPLRRDRLSCIVDSSEMGCSSNDRFARIFHFQGLLAVALGFGMNRISGNDLGRGVLSTQGSPPSGSCTA